MRALILSDIHSNLEALTAVLDDARDRGGFDALWCLGDTVGYGPDPGPCIQMVRGHNLRAVMGNHDFVAVGKGSADDFNHAARVAVLWTSDQLSVEDVRFLEGLPMVERPAPFTLVHGSLRDEITEYLLDEEAARATFRLLETPYCLVGHSHIPFICLENSGSPQFLEFVEDQVYPLEEQRMIINPGSVGQPRDHDPRPSYAVYDSREETIQRRRVSYRIKDTQDKITKARLPGFLAERLSSGV